MTTSVSNYLPLIRAVVKHVEEHSNWVVLVTPENKVEELLQAALTTLRPPSSSMGGRTLLCSGGGKVSVASKDVQVYGSDFLVMFVGFSSELSPRDQIAFHTWRQQANGSLIQGEQPGDLRVSA